MSAYEDAREKAWDAIAALLTEWNRLDGEGHEHPVIYDTGKIGRYTESPLFDAAVGTFLAALPPSIVVDGQVVELGRVLSLLRERDHNLDLSTDEVLDAAREVAEGEGR